MSQAEVGEYANLPVAYCQQNYWDQLGRCAGITIHDYGCYLTAAAMIACKHGQSIDPPNLNQAWMWLYVNGCDATDYLLPQTYPDIVHEGSPWGRDYLFGLDPAEQSAIVQIDGTQTLGYITHYLAWDHCEGGRVYALDPWYGDLCDVESRYGNVIQKVAIYHGPQAAGIAPAINYQLAGGGDMGEATQITYPFDDSPDRADIYLVKSDGHVWGRPYGGGAGEMQGAQGQGFVDYGTAGAGFVAVSARWDQRNRLCLLAVDRDGNGFMFVQRTDGGLDTNGWEHILSGVAVT